ncbi:MAG: AI-2E family transporter [Verrucomicrobia bacterium]|nr:AI-2E family transporter [Verrucomicrobiota bacterium]
MFLLFLRQAVPVLLLLFAGALIALALRFISDTVSRFTRIPPLWSLTIVLLLLFVGTGFGIAYAMPAMWEQMKELGQGLQNASQFVEDKMNQTEAGKWIANRIPPSDEMAEKVPWMGIANIFGTTFGSIAAFLLTLTIGIFLAYNPGLYISGFLRLIPKEKRNRTSQIISELGNTLRWWMVGQLISMLILAVTTWAMLWILGVPLALVLGLITGLLTFIPYLGPLIALIPILLIAFVESPSLALWVLGLYMVIQNMEASVIMPIVFQKTVHLPPALTLIAQVLLGGMLGFVGIVLATPLMAAGLVVVKMVYVEDVIRDDMNKPVKEMPDG